MRFPNGLREISAACHDQGIRFGLWFEPEVIGSLSAVRRNHPEWLHHLDGQPPPVNDRAILNLGVPAARRYAFERITRILSRVGVDWMKWDFNADLGAGGWAPELSETLTDLDPLVAHYEGLYRLQDAIPPLVPRPDPRNVRERRGPDGRRTVVPCSCQLGQRPARAATQAGNPFWDAACASRGGLQ
jgi:alpha-galactosidase